MRLSKEEHTAIIAQLSYDLEPTTPLPDWNAIAMELVHMRNEREDVMTDTNTTAQAPDDGVMAMDEAPERIWVYPSYITGWNHGNAVNRKVIGGTEYVRADIHAQTLAANAALVERLEEARGVIEGLQINLAASIGELNLWCIEDNGEGYNSPYANNALDSARAFLAGGE
jgi:hypothetical protein